MKQALLLIPALCLAACAAQNRTSTDSFPAATEQTARDESPSDANKIREPSHVHTYVINDYVDPNNPRLRHRGHAVDVVEQDEKWNLNPTDATDGNYGPVTTASDPNAAPNPYSAEFETELSQQRDQYRQLTAIGTQMTSEMDRIQKMAEKEAEAVSDNASLRNRLEELQREIDELKPPPATPVAPNAQKKPSWLDPIWNLFRLAPQGKPVVEEKPAFHASADLRAAEIPLPAPEISTTPPVAKTSASDAMPSTHSPPSPNPSSGTTNSDTSPLPQP
jgi:hypothetical protein